MRALADVSRARILARDSGGSCGIERTSEAAIDGQRLCNGRGQLGQREPRADRLGPARYSVEDDARDETALRIDGNCSDRTPRPASRCDEVQRLTRHRAPNRDDRISTRHGSAECQTHDGTGLGARRRDRQTGGLGAKRDGDESAQCSCCIDASSQGCPCVEDASLKLTYGTAASGRGSRLRPISPR